MTETPTQKFLRQAFNPEEVTSENDAESRGMRNMRRVEAIINHLDDASVAETIDDYIRGRAKAFRGEDLDTTSGSAGEILTRLSALSGADFSDLINPSKDPAQIIREAHKNSKR